MTLTFVRDLNSVKVNQRVNYLGKRLFSFKVKSRHTDTHIGLPGQLLYLDP